jgi:biotin carboxyl carrier protein
MSSPPPGLTDADITRILHLIDNLHNVEVRIEVEGMKLHIRKLPVEDAAGVPPTAALPGTQVSEQATATIEPPRSQESERRPAAAKEAGSGGSKSNSTAIPPGAVAIRAPMLGRFFRAASPTDQPYVDIGSEVSPDDTVCIIEVMKLFNTVKAGVRGTIIGIAVENADMVEHDSVLFLVRPV